MKRTILLLSTIFLIAASNPRAVPFGTSLPATCNVGDLFFKTNATDGAQIYACPRQNVWTVEGTTSSATIGNATLIYGIPISGTLPQNGQALIFNGSTWIPGSPSSITGFVTSLGDLQVVYTNATTLTIGPNCSSVNICNARYGNTVYNLASPITITISSGTGNADIYLTSAGIINVADSLTLSCSGTCVHNTNGPTFPTDSIPLAIWHATTNVWDATGGTDLRSALNSDVVNPGTGLNSTISSGITTLSIDNSVLSLKVATPSTSSSTCSVNQWSTDGSYYYLCTASNTWKRTALSSW